MPPTARERAVGEIVIANERKLRPALDVVDGTVYVTVPLRIRTASGTEQRSLVMTSRSERYPLSRDALSKAGFWFDGELEDLQALPKDRWSAGSVESFLSGSASKVDAARAFASVRGLLARRIDLESDDLDTVALWTAATYLFPFFQSFPYIYVRGPMGSGKTTLLEAVQRLAFNAVLTTNITRAALFRVINATRPTLLIDEAENFSRVDVDERRQLLNSGYASGGLVSLCERPTKDSRQRVVGFEVYSPKMLASIQPLNAVLRSRCIEINMLKTRKHEYNRNAFAIDAADFNAVRDDLYCFLLGTAAGELAEARANMPEGDFVGRGHDLSLPLLTLAWMVSREQFEKTNNYLRERLGQAQASAEGDANDNRVLYALRDLVTTEGEYAPLYIAEKVREDGNGYIEPSVVGTILTNFGWRSKRTKKGQRYRLTPKDVADKYERYIGSDAQDPDDASDRIRLPEDELFADLGEPQDTRS